jgi:hypothetical protein
MDMESAWRMITSRGGGLYNTLLTGLQILNGAWFVLVHSVRVKVGSKCSQDVVHGPNRTKKGCRVRDDSTYNIKSLDPSFMVIIQLNMPCTKR